MCIKDHRIKKKTIVRYTDYLVGIFTRNVPLINKNQKDRRWATDAEKYTFLQKNEKKGYYLLELNLTG